MQENTNKCYASDNYVESLYQGVVLVFTLYQWKVGGAIRLACAYVKFQNWYLMIEFDAELSGRIIEK